MANPYPPQMQPMMQPSHGQHPHGPPMQMQPPPGMPPRADVVRRGTSRAVPVVVSAGLAIGVFCGLLFGLGTGEEVIASPSTGTNVKPADPTEAKLPIPSTVGSSTTVQEPAPTPPAAGSGTQVAAAGSAAPAAGSAAPAAGSAAPAAGSAAPAAGSAAPTTTAAEGAGSGSAAPAVVAAKTYKVKFKFIPETVAQAAKVTIDGKAVEGVETDIDLGTAEAKDIKIVVKAAGYRTFAQKVTVSGDMFVQVEMTKRPASTPAVGPRPGGTGTKKPPGGSGGGLIDI